MIRIQKLQRKMLGIEGRLVPYQEPFTALFEAWAHNEPLPLFPEFSPSIIEKFYTTTINFLQENGNLNLKQQLLACLSEEKLTTDNYRTILEIYSLYRHFENPDRHRFHCLQQEVLSSLARLVKIRIVEVDAFWGDKASLVNRLKELPSGIYHLSLRKHVCAYIKQEGEEFLWDIAYDRLQQAQPQRLRSCGSGRNWYAINKCENIDLKNYLL